MESETDIFIVFEIEPSKERFALHIEAKMDARGFEPMQEHNYALRARHMMNNAKYLNYTSFETVLLAPAAYRDRELDRCSVFDRFIAFEDAARFIPDFAS